MILGYQSAGIFIWGFSYQLGKVRRNLHELKAGNLLSNAVETLNDIGYQYNFGVGVDETLLTLAAGPFSSTLKRCRNPSAVVFHHSYAENAIIPWADEDPDLMSRCHYFPATLMKQFQLDHLPYFGSFASGCSGFLSMLLSASGLLGDSSGNPVICLTADIRPRGSNFDASREKILTSDCSAAFIIGREEHGYQLLGVNYYSTTRPLVPLVEIVKRTVQMIMDLAKELDLVPLPKNLVIHYPNIFPEAWRMVTHYLRIGVDQHTLDELGDRAHCLSSDSVITLDKLHQSQRDRLHVVVNFGSGLHLGVCILKEISNNASSI